MTVYATPGASGAACSSVPVDWSYATRTPSTRAAPTPPAAAGPAVPPTVMRSSMVERRRRPPSLRSRARRRGRPAASTRPGVAVVGIDVPGHAVPVGRARPAAAGCRTRRRRLRQPIPSLQPNRTSTAVSGPARVRRVRLGPPMTVASGVARTSIGGWSAAPRTRRRRTGAGPGWPPTPRSGSAGSGRARPGSAARRSRAGRSGRGRPARRRSGAATPPTASTATQPDGQPRRGPQAQGHALPGRQCPAASRGTEPRCRRRGPARRARRTASGCQTTHGGVGTDQHERTGVEQRRRDQRQRRAPGPRGELGAGEPGQPGQHHRTEHGVGLRLDRDQRGEQAGHGVAGRVEASVRRSPSTPPARAETLDGEQRVRRPCAATETGATSQAGARRSSDETSTEPSAAPATSRTSSDPL